MVTENYLHLFNIKLAGPVMFPGPSRLQDKEGLINSSLRVLRKLSFNVIESNIMNNDLITLPSFFPLKGFFPSEIFIFMCMSVCMYCIWVPFAFHFYGSQKRGSGSLGLELQTAVL